MANLWLLNYQKQKKNQHACECVNRRRKQEQKRNQWNSQKKRPSNGCEKFLFHLWNVKHTKWEEQKAQPKQRPSIAHHMQMARDDGLDQSQWSQNRSFRNLLIIRIDCIIWTYDILINGFFLCCACDFGCTFIVHGWNDRAHHTIWNEDGERKIKNRQKTKTERETKAKIKTCCNRLINETVRTRGRFSPQSSRSRARVVLALVWFGFIEFLCKQNCKNGHKPV